MGAQTRTLQQYRTLQQSIMYCNKVQRAATTRTRKSTCCGILRNWRCNTLSRTATHYNTLQRTVTHCNTLQRAVMHCNRLQQTATDCTRKSTRRGPFRKGLCTTLQHTATRCNTLRHTATHCNTLQHTVMHCNTLQHTATIFTRKSVRRGTLRKGRGICNRLQHAATTTATHYITLQRRRSEEHTSELQSR